MAFSALRVLLPSSALILLLAFASCRHHERHGALQMYCADSISLENRNGVVYHNGQAFTGRLYALQPNSRDTLYCRDYTEGKENGMQKLWYDNGALQETRHYHNGNKTGTHKGYWPNGNKKFAYTFADDLYEGAQYEWYPDGKPYSQKHYLLGHEHGLQQVWDMNGKLLSNYDAQNGRNYGNIGTKHCTSPWRDSAHRNPAY